MMKENINRASQENFNAAEQNSLEGSGIKKQQKPKYKKWLLLVLLFLAVGIGFYIFVLWSKPLSSTAFLRKEILREEIPPGCINFKEGTIGGCFGTSIIKNLKIEPEIPCLKIKVNNCNGGVLELLENRCKKDLRIANLILPYVKVNEYEDYCSIKLTKDENGNVVVNKISSADGLMDWDFIETLKNKHYDEISAEGVVGKRKFNLVLDNSGVKAEPSIECLSFKTLIFAGVKEAIAVTNKCEESVEIGRAEIDYYVRRTENPGGYYGVELIKDSSGMISAIESNGNFSSYIPDKNEKLEAEGEIGGEKFKISYIKTKRLCD